MLRTRGLFSAVLRSDPADFYTRILNLNSHSSPIVYARAMACERELRAYKRTGSAYRRSYRGENPPSDRVSLRIIHPKFFSAAGGTPFLATPPAANDSVPHIFPKGRRRTVSTHDSIGKACSRDNRENRISRFDII